MAWKRKSTSISIDVDADLDEFNRDQLLQALIDDGCITEQEAEILSGRTSLSRSPFSFKGVESEDLDLAKHYLRRGDKAEALHHVENYLGRDWIGELTQ